MENKITEETICNSIIKAQGECIGLPCAQCPGSLDNSSLCSETGWSGPTSRRAKDIIRVRSAKQWLDENIKGKVIPHVGDICEFVGHNGQHFVGEVTSIDSKTKAPCCGSYTAARCYVLLTKKERSEKLQNYILQEKATYARR